MILALSRQPHGARNAVAHELEDGTSLRWEVLDDAPADALLAAEVELDPSVEWLLRCDRVDFPPGGVAYRHTHPGPGIRYLLFGRIRIESQIGSGTVIEVEIPIAGPADRNREPEEFLAQATTFRSSGSNPMAFASRKRRERGRIVFPLEVLRSCSHWKFFST